MLADLNDDCLLLIFSFLPLNDQLGLTDVCQRFQYLIVNYIWSKKYHNIDTRMPSLQSLSLHQYKKFFQINKDNIRKLKVADANNFVYVYNSNQTNERPNYTFYFGLKMPNLKVLCCKYAQVHDGYIKMLSKYCPKLEYLYLGKSIISGAHLEDMNCLRAISLGDHVIQMPMSMNEYEDMAFY